MENIFQCCVGLKYDTSYLQKYLTFHTATVSEPGAPRAKGLVPRLTAYVCEIFSLPSQNVSTVTSTIQLVIK